ncbi:uncharacterized protein At5g08430-like isoform X2 [Wolffia australiana]
MEELRKEEVAEDYCFVCKDGGRLLICEHGDCLKVYHPQCVGKDESFLEGEERWRCARHKCFVCHQSSNILCFCCPKACCIGCIEAAKLIEVRKSKGFCGNCLELLMSDKINESHKSTQGELDLGSSGTKELFMEYWHQIKIKERISSKELQNAETLLKKRYNLKISCTDVQHIDKNVEVMSGDICVTTLKVGQGRGTRKYRRRKRVFKGWGSVELFEFLRSLGKDTSQPLDQWDVYKIIEEYICKNNLFLSKAKRKTIVCDSKLHSLFGKVKIKFPKIYNILEGHFATHAAQDALSLESEKDSSDKESQIQKGTSSGCTDKQQGGHFASVVPENLKLVYLRKSLVMELLKDSQTFDRKVIGCFVRIKNNSENVDFSSDKAFVLLKISGIDTLSETYAVGGMSTNIILRAHNCSKNINISLLSDDDFMEEECEDLRLFIERGSFERPTVEELEEKCRFIREDIVNHLIKRELMILQRQIERANEKGWYREKMELIGRRALLQTHGERERLLKEIPKIIADV